MRFIANGPSIPDDLLLARDQGRVVFFCGAGVSRAKAKLPDFFELAAAVTRTLGVPPDAPSMKIIAEAKEIGRRTGVDGLISADRIFGLLEQDFLTRDVQEAVAKALTFERVPDLSAHQTLLRLATTRDGLVRLVTTNFDRLFDSCVAGLPTFTPPHLPDPSRATEFNGVVYLHGKVAATGNSAEEDGFVLSSSEFGRAYLSDGWATSFVREILDRYYVVFVGYSADDPPVQYLLEALNRTSGPMDGVYAFQSGDSSYAESRWRHKGVTAIAYDSADGHVALWDTLDAWAIRADDPESWAESVVRRARPGPEFLEPHERGQVAHLVSTIEGLRKFGEGDAPPSATWLCVFDPYRRYAKPGRRGRYGDEEPFIDPFELYSLDTDAVPDRIDPEDHYAKRETPSGAWDAFSPNAVDRAGLRDQHVGSIRGQWSQQTPHLPPRLSQFGTWIAKVAPQPEAVWWAARQVALHHNIRDQISWHLDRAEAASPDTVRQAWRYLLEFWSENHIEPFREWHDLAHQVSSDGWGELILRRFAKSGRPYISVSEGSWSAPMPYIRKDHTLSDLVRVDVEYPNVPSDISIPDEWRDRVVLAVRRNLETALDLENEIGGYGLYGIAPITPDDARDGDTYSRTRGLSAWVLYYVTQLEQLVALDAAKGQAEVQRWLENDKTIFARLRMWALGQSQLVATSQFLPTLNKIPDEAFWDSHHARDLLLSIAARWSALPIKARVKVERRLLRGPSQWEGEDGEHYAERKAWATLSRLNWLQEKGCQLQLDIVAVTAKLRELAPQWRAEFAMQAADSLEGRSGSIRTETDHSALLAVSLRTTLAKAQELSGRRGADFVEHEPFSGLAEKEPVRAFAVLRDAAKSGNFPEWAWRSFLDPDRRKGDRPRLTAFVAEQLSRYSPEDLSRILRPATSWLQKSSETLASQYPTIFSHLVAALTTALSQQSSQSQTAIVRGSGEADWTMEAINSPTGKLAECLFDDPTKSDLNRNQGFPREWLSRVENLLVLPGDLRRHALVIFAHNLSWFFFVDSDWTNANLLSILTSHSEEDQAALWAGFLWGGKVHGREFFETLKPHMLRLAKHGNLERRGHSEGLVALLLSAWAIVDETSGERWVSDDELRDLLLNSSDDVRSHVLWAIERWSREDNEKWYPLTLHLLQKIWPRQLAAKSATISARLCGIAFSDEKHFAVLAAAVLPHLTKAAGHLTVPNIRRSSDNIVDLHPRETLALLHAVLPDNVSAWPYGIEATIARIGQADPALNTDDRLIELKRRWDAR